MHGLLHFAGRHAVAIWIGAVTLTAFVVDVLTGHV